MQSSRFPSCLAASRGAALAASVFVATACNDRPTGPPDPPLQYSVSETEAIVSVSEREDLQIPEGNGIDINDAGVVVGGREDKGRMTGFIWQRTTGEKDLGSLGGAAYTTALAINERGQVAGSSTPAGTNRRVAYLRSPSGEFRALGPSSTYSFANDVNDLGIAVGNITADGRVRAFRWSADGGLVLLPDLGGDFTQARAINNRGEVVGTSNSRSLHRGTSQAVAWSPSGELRHLPTLGGSYATAQDINNQGQIVGLSTDAVGKYRAVIWHPDGRVQDIGTLGGPEGAALGVNDRGEVVGSTTTASGERRGFFWTQGGGMIDLGVLPNRPYSTARRINENGQIVGYSGGSVVLWQVTRGKR